MSEATDDREEIIRILDIEGAQTGECGHEPGEVEDCENGCRELLEEYADALITAGFSRAQVVPQPDRQATRQRMHEFMFSEAMTVVRALGYSQERYDEFLDGLAAAAALSPAPLTIDREALRGAIGNVLCNVMNYPEKVQARLLGTDTAPLTDKVTDAVIAHLSAQPVEGEVTDDMVEKAARAIFAEEQCDRHQKRSAASLEENWLTRLDDHDREEYRSLARAALNAADYDAAVDQQQQEVIATDPLSFWPTAADRAASIEQEGADRG